MCLSGQPRSAVATAEDVPGVVAAFYPGQPRVVFIQVCLLPVRLMADQSTGSAPEERQECGIIGHAGFKRADQQCDMVDLERDSGRRQYGYTACNRNDDSSRSTKSTCASPCG